MANSSLGAAKKAKNDEFYTYLADVEKELRRYADQLRGKVILCNCDDPFESNFFKYFAMHFNHLGLKKLIAICYDPSPIAGSQLALFDVEPPLKKGMNKDTKHAYKIEISEVVDADGDGSINLADVEYLLKYDGNSLKLLEGNGDFRSDECIKLLKRADIVVTNPPFSLFSEYLAQLVEYDKQFVIVAPDTALHYKNIFGLIKDNKLWLGYGRIKQFKQADGTVKKMGNVGWLTNLDTTKRHELLTTYKKYSPEEYPHYDNYDAIDVGRTAHIPEDFFGKMGVPDTFLSQYNPDQFELIGIPTGDSGKDIGVARNYRGRTDISLIKDGKPKCPYSRIIIRRRRKRHAN